MLYDLSSDHPNQGCKETSLTRNKLNLHFKLITIYYAYLNNTFSILQILIYMLLNTYVSFLFYSITFVFYRNFAFSNTATNGSITQYHLLLTVSLWPVPSYGTDPN